METFTKYIAVAIGSMLGGMARYYLGGSLLSRIAVPFPFATFFINITGSFAIGFFLTLAVEKFDINPHVRLAVAVGFLGAYTTFSTFEYETLRLIEEKHLTQAFLNVFLSVIIGFAAVVGGAFAARKIECKPVLSSANYLEFEHQANLNDPHQTAGAERDIRDSEIKRKI